MAWIEPVTDRQSGGAMMTYEDMNRITGNVAYLQEALLGSATMSKTTWTQNDLIETAVWHEITDSVDEMADMLGVVNLGLTDEMIYTNINYVESLCLQIYGALNNQVEDVEVYGSSVVDENEVAEIIDTSMLEQSTISLWNGII